METKETTLETTFRNLWMWRPGKWAIATTLTTLSAISLSACSMTEPSAGDATPAASASPASTLLPSTAAPQTNGEFAFPQINCGDQATSPSESWYPVYIDNGDIADIRSKYCKDAVSVIRDKTGTASVQVASFTSYGKAQRFALAVGGTVESVGVSRPSLDAQAANSRSSAGASGAASGTAASGSTTSTSSQKSAVLASNESGSPINIRASASTSAEVTNLGYGGDRLQVIEKKQGDGGYTWYSVKLESGATGWVRGDFVTEDSLASAPSASSENRQESRQSASAPESRTGSGLSGSSSSGSSSSGTGSATRLATLTASEAGSPINVRSSASTSANVQSTGYSGDRIQIAEKMQGDDGYTWYKVRFEAGDMGWVRSDFVSN